MLRQRGKGAAAADGDGAQDDRPSAPLAGPRARGAGSGGGGSGGTITPLSAFALLAAARLLSAWFNIIHDCDETYNYLEPLHYLLHGSGMQTWEYSAAFALRSYLYLLLHAAVAAPAWLLGAGRGKLVGFYLLKAALGLASAATETWLYRAVARRYRPALSHALLLFLCIASGLFAASTSLLPSSFTMYALTAAAAAMLEGRPYWVVVAAVVGVVWGWCVAGLAFLPYALYVLVAAPFYKAVGVLLACLLGTLGPLVLCDKHYYGRWTASLWNFVQYNVVGGGDSALYGVEGPTFYLRNGFNNLQLLLPLALLLPLVAAAAGGDSLALPERGGSSSTSGASGKQPAPHSSRPGSSRSNRSSMLRLLACVSPVYVWLAAVTALPHKEERFLYVVYPLICLAAAASFVALCSLARRALGAVLAHRLAAAAVRGAAALFLAGTCLLALSRSAALVVNYGAPLRIYRHLPEVVGPGPPIAVCTGAEWHRFPSSFFLPGPRYRLQFIKSGFNGLLPAQFDDAKGGTRSAPPGFNDRNQEQPAHYWPSAANCSYVMTMLDEGRAPIDSIGGMPAWETVAALPFVDNARSPPLFRAFYLPGLSSRQNRHMEYVLLRRQPPQQQQP